MVTKAVGEFSICLVLAIVLSSCVDKTGKAETSTLDSIQAIDTVISLYQVDTELSEVLWTGKVIGVYGHHGKIDILEGTLTTKGEQITDGRVVIDMKSIVPLDSSSYQDKEGSRITDLQTHLMTNDFFLSDEYPTSSFEIKHQDNNLLVGDLTIRGITNEETIVLSYLEVLPEGLVGDGLLVFDRHKYKVNWKHTVNDYILADEIEVGLKIVAR